MKNLILGIIIGLTCTACCIAKDQSYINHMKVILTDKNYIYTTTVNTEEGTYRIFTVENKNGNTNGITAIKIKWLVYRFVLFSIFDKFNSIHYKVDRFFIMNAIFLQIINYRFASINFLRLVTNFIIQHKP